jgi:hypothetical protein
MATAAFARSFNWLTENVDFGRIKDSVIDALNLTLAAVRDGEGDQAAPGLEEQEPKVAEHVKQNEVEGREMIILGLVGAKDPQKYMSL